MNNVRVGPSNNQYDAYPLNQTDEDSLTSAGTTSTNLSVNNGIVEILPPTGQVASYQEVTNIGNQCVPQTKFSEEECTKPAGNIDDLIKIIMEIPNAALSALGLGDLQNKIAKALGDIGELTLKLLDDFSKALSDVAQQLYEMTKNEEAKAAEEALKNARRGGIMGIISGLVEIVGALVTIAFSGGIGTVAGIMMLADGIVRLSAGITMTVNPESGGDILLMQKSGIFFVFDKISDGLGQYVMLGVSILLGFGALLEAGVALASNLASFGRTVITAAKQGAGALAQALAPAVGVAASVLVVASAIMRMIGQIASLVEMSGDEASNTAQNAREGKKGIMDTWQALNLGLVGFLAYELVTQTGLSELMQNSRLGITGDMIIEMVFYAIIGMLGDMALAGISQKLVTLPEDAFAKSPAFEKFRTLMQNANFISQLVQLPTQLQNIMLAIQKKIYTEERNNIDLYTQIMLLMKKIIESARQAQEDLYSDSMDGLTEIASDNNALTQGTIALLDQVGNANFRYA